MRTALIGHRGVGKSSFLRRVKSYYSEAGQSVLCLDLDHEIELRTTRSVQDIFTKDGEGEFRRVELETYAAVDRETAASENVYLAVGAGFDPLRISSQWKALWIRRTSDSRGRIFTDRPRLNAALSSLQEFEERFESRQKSFSARADETLWLDEGLDSADLAEKNFVLNDFHELGGALTLLPENFHSRFDQWLMARLKWGIRWFELRDDLLSEEQINIALRILPDDRALMSFRLLERFESTKKFVEKYRLAFDWSLDLGPCELLSPRFLSLHDRKTGESLESYFARFPSIPTEGTVLKAAPFVSDFTELASGDVWQKAAPNVRAFLPRSNDATNARWAWYRALRLASAPLNFIREGDGSGADQPTLLQWARMRELKKAPSQFAAVLGDPVQHSFTPMEHKDFFARMGAPVFSIRVPECEWSAALDILRGWGLVWAAVTAPLKVQAFKTCSIRDQSSEAFGAINTIQWDKERLGWKGTNTDLFGFKEVIAAETSLGQVAVWGGGGTLNIIKAVLPQAQYFSIRTGENRSPNGISAKDLKPDTVIWAASRSRGEAQKMPTSAWQPKVVIDLNYAEDSSGRAFTLDRVRTIDGVERAARYVSGLKMFRAQAKAQREFWENS
jgi:shikimate kinase